MHPAVRQLLAPGGVMQLRQMFRDGHRTTCPLGARFLVSLPGLTVLRFWASDVESELDGVMETILNSLGQIDPTRATGAWYGWVCDAVTSETPTPALRGGKGNICFNLIGIGLRCIPCRIVRSPIAAWRFRSRPCRTCFGANPVSRCAHPRRRQRAAFATRLRLAALNATTRLGQPNGFFGDGRVRIPLPGLLGQTQRSLSAFGMSRPLDDLQREINHAAETTMPRAAVCLWTRWKRSPSPTPSTSCAARRIPPAPICARTPSRPQRAAAPAHDRSAHQSGAFTLMRAALREVGLPP